MLKSYFNVALCGYLLSGGPAASSPEVSSPPANLVDGELENQASDPAEHQYPSSADGILYFSDQSEEVLKDYVSVLESYKLFRSDFDLLRGLETASERYATFAAFDKESLTNRLLIFGDISPKGYVSLDPEKLGTFAVNSSKNVSHPSLQAKAGITFSERTRHFTPSQNGMFPTIYAAENETLRFDVTFPELEPGSIIATGLPGGGTISNERLTLDEDRSVSFDFQCNAFAGSYQIECSHGTGIIGFEVWVGPISAHLSQLIVNCEPPLFMQNGPEAFAE